MLVRSPNSRNKDGLGTLNDVASARSCDRRQSMPTIDQRRVGLSLHRRSDGSDPSSVRINHGGPDGGPFEEAEFESGLGGETLTDGLSGGENETRGTGDTADLGELGGDLSFRRDEGV